MPLQIPAKLVLQNGLASVNGLIAEAPPGTYEIKFECKNVSLKTASLFLTITSGPSLSPVSIPDTCAAGATLPVAVIQLLTHKGEKIKVEEKRVNLEFNKTSYSCIVDPSDSTYHFSNVPCPTKAGSYELKFQCKNVKTNVEYISSITVTAGPPSKLESPDPTVELNCDGNNGGLIIERIRLQMEDSFGNEVNSGGTVRITIAPIDDVQLSGKELPKIRGATQQKMSDGVATFEKICLAEGVGKSGVYSLFFSLVNNSDVAPKVLEFFYQNELDFLEHKVQLQKQKMQINKSIKDKNADLMKLHNELDNYDNEKKAIETKFSQVQELLHTLIPEMKKEELRSRNALLNYVAKIEAEMEQLHSKPPRAPKSRSMDIPGLEDDDNVCVDNEAEARLLAKNCGRRIDGIVVKNQQGYKKYSEILKDSKTGVYIIVLESMLPHPKTSATSGHLEISLEQSAPKEGFLGHASNRVQLRSEHEYLRKVLVWNLFRDLLVFDTMEHAFEYRTHVVGNVKKQCPTIIAVKDENTLESSGMVLVGEKKLQSLSSTGDPSFGQLPLSENPNYKRLVEIKSSLEEFIETATKRKQFNTENSNNEELQHRAQELESEVSGLMEDLKKVNDGLKSLETAHPSKSSGSGSSAADISMSGSLDSQPPLSSTISSSSPPPRKNGSSKSKTNKRKFVDQD